MLRLILISLLFAIKVLANEPDGIIIVSNGKINQIPFKDLKKIELTTANHHPKIRPLGELKYSGYLIKDILSKAKLKPDDFITIVGKTGQFSVEISAKELLSSNNIIATDINGVPVKTEENGLQIIYSPETIEKFPHLKERQYWCWWVRSLILDEKFVPQVKVRKAATSLESQLPWPVPYGISSRGIAQEVKVRTGSLLNFKKIKVEFLNGNSQEIIADEKSKYFLTNPIGNKLGAYGLHQVIEKDGKVQTIVSNLYYIKRLEAL
jgi:hypothetical protein